MRHYRPAEIIVDPLLTTSLVAWLQTQPEWKAYDYNNNQTCPLAQYFSACGYKDPIVCSGSFTHGAGAERWQNAVIMPAGWNDIVHRSPWNFGGALARARALL